MPALNAPDIDVAAPDSLAFALEAARLGEACRLPFPDNVVLATALQYGAELWTHDAHFRGLHGIHFVEVDVA